MVGPKFRKLYISIKVSSWIGGAHLYIILRGAISHTHTHTHAPTPSHPPTHTHTSSKHFWGIRATIKRAKWEVGRLAVERWLDLSLVYCAYQPTKQASSVREKGGEGWGLWTPPLWANLLTLQTEPILHNEEMCVSTFVIILKDSLYQLKIFRSKGSGCNSVGRAVA